MRNFTVTVDADGRTELSESLVGYSGEHNSVGLCIGFTDKGTQVYGAADFFRVIVDGAYSEKLYLNQGNVNYTLPQEVMIPPEAHCQLLAYTASGDEISTIVKSEIFCLKINPSEVPWEKLVTKPDIFENSIARCEAAAESAAGDAATAADSANISVSASLNASESAVSAENFAHEAALSATSAEENAQKATAAAEILDLNKVTNALKGTATGKAVALKDVSPLPHSVDVSLSSDSIDKFATVKHDFDVSEFADINLHDLDSIIVEDFTINNTNVTVSAICYGQVYFGLNFELAGHRICNPAFQDSNELWSMITVTFTLEDGVLSWNGTKTYFDSEATEGDTVQFSGTDSDCIYSEDEKILNLAFMTEGGSEMINTVTLNSVSTVLGSDVKVQVYGKNLMKTKVCSQSIQTIPVTSNENGVITVCGTAPYGGGRNGWGNFFDAVYLLKGVTYTFSPSPNGLITCLNNAAGNFLMAATAGIPLIFTPDESAYYNLGYNFDTAVAIDTSFTVQLEIGSASTEYEQYKEPTEYMPDTEGRLSLESVYPSMTLITDDEEATVTADYNRDINKVVAGLANAIVALGGSLNA